MGQPSLRRPPFAGMATPFRPSSSRHRSSSNSTCLLRDRRSCFAISANRDLRLAGTRTNRATLGSVMATSKNSRIQQFSICNVLILSDTLCFRRMMMATLSTGDRRLLRQNLGDAKRQYPDLPKQQLSVLRDLTATLHLSIFRGELLYFSGKWYVSHSGLLRIAHRRR